MLLRMNIREAVDLVYGLAESFPPSSELRHALRMVARASERGHRMASATLPAVASAVQSIVMARAILSMALDGGGKVEKAAAEAHELLVGALGLVEQRIDDEAPADIDDEEEEGLLG